VKRDTPSHNVTGGREIGGAAWKPTVRSFFTDENHVLYHLWTLICGLSLVVPLCVGLIERFPLHFGYRPTGLGIVSVTTLTNYPAQQETYYYVLALVVLMLVPGVVWLAWLVFSLSLARVLDREFGAVATRGCWALSLFVLVFPYALLRPQVTFVLLAPAAVTVLLVQVLLVLALPAHYDFEVRELGWLRKLQRWPVKLPARLSRTALWVFVMGTVVSWGLYVGLAGRGERGGAAVVLMTLMVLALPLLFLLGWTVWCQRWAGALGREPGTSGGMLAVRRVLALLVGLGVVGYLYGLLGRARQGALEVMLAAVTVVAVLLARPALWDWLVGRRRWLRVVMVVAAAVVVVTALALVTFEPASLSKPPGLDPDFLREDGSHLAWANDILSGKFQGRDFYSMYGPLLDYGLVATMKVVGVRAEAAPLYWWVGRTVGAVAAALLLWQLTGSALFAFLGLLVLHVGVGWRTAAALATLAAFIHFGRTRQVCWALLAGV